MSEEKLMKGATFHPNISPFAKERYKNRARTPTDLYNEHM